MARPKEFDKEMALDAAIGLFRENGYAATSADMLTRAMKIGRQSLYDTFGDKWRLYCAAVERYNQFEVRAHLEALSNGPRAVDGIWSVLRRVVESARAPCLGIGSITEFGDSREDLTKCHAASGRLLRSAFTARFEQAQEEGDISATLNPDHAAGYLLATIATLRLAARGGAGDGELQRIAEFAMNGLG